MVLSLEVSVECRLDDLLLLLWRGVSLGIVTSLMSIAMDRMLHWVLHQHGALVLEVAVEVEGPCLCLVDHLEDVAVLEDLSLMERHLELSQYSVCMP